MKREAKGDTVDDIFKSLGVWGKWQILQLALIQVQHLGAAFQLLGIVFLGYEPPFTCNDGERTDLESATWSSAQNTTYVQHGDCKLRNTASNVTTTCNHGYMYAAPLKTSTIVTEWDLVCNKEYQKQLTQTIFVAGQLVGATLVTIVADRYGRKWVSVICQWAVFAIGLATVFSPNILVFSILRFPLGAFQQGIIMTGSVIPLELIPVEKRTYVFLMGGVTWSICLSLLSVVGYAFRNHSWRYLQLAYTSVSLVVILHTCLLDESLRWLYANGKKKEAAKIIRKAIRKNNAKVDDILEACLNFEDNKEVEMVYVFKPTSGEATADNYIPDCNQEDAAAKDSPSSNRSQPVSLYDNDQSSRSREHLQGETNTKPSFSQNQEEEADQIPGNNENRVEAEGKAFSAEKLQQNKEPSENEQTGPTNAKGSPKQPSSKKYTLLDVIRNKRLLLTASVTCFGWIINNLVYFGLTLASSKLVGDRFVNFALMSLIELPSAFVSYFTMYRYGRKATILFFDALAGVVLILSVALKAVYGDSITITVLSIAGKFGASAAFGALFTYTPELYPTNLRSLGLGISSSTSRIGGMVAPFFVMLAKIVPWAPGTIFGTLSFVVCGLVMLLPETRDKELPQTIEEIELWSKNSKTHRNSNNDQTSTICC